MATLTTICFLTGTQVWEQQQYPHPLAPSQVRTLRLSDHCPNRLLVLGPRVGDSLALDPAQEDAAHTCSITVIPPAFSLINAPHLCTPCPPTQELSGFYLTILFRIEG